MRDLYKAPYQKFEKLHPQELRGTEGMKVSLVDWPCNPYGAIATGQSASWRPWKRNFSANEILELLSGMADGTIWPGQAFEAVNFTFAIENISRATTHQLVRIRVGAGFMQESGREGKWGGANFITPLTILENSLEHLSFVDDWKHSVKAYERKIAYHIPPQDSRFGMGHCVAQNVWMTINFAALLNWCSKRLCCTVQWEINTLARMMRDCVLERFPHLGVLLKSNCERAGGCKSITNFYKPGEENNGNKVYFPFEGTVCGMVGNYEHHEIEALLDSECDDIEKTHREQF